MTYPLKHGGDKERNDQLKHGGDKHSQYAKSSIRMNPDRYVKWETPVSDGCQKVYHLQELTDVKYLCSMFDVVLDVLHQDYDTRRNVMVTQCVFGNPYHRDAAIVRQNFLERFGK